MHEKRFKPRLYLAYCAFPILMYKFKDFHSEYNSNQSSHTYKRKQEYKKYVHKYPSFKDPIKSQLTSAVFTLAVKHKL